MFLQLLIANGPLIFLDFKQVNSLSRAETAKTVI